MIYLDNAATSWPKPQVVYEAINDCLHTAGANPGRGGHAMGRKAGRIIADTRDEVAALFGINESTQVVFTHNATAAINLALLGVVKPGWRVVTTAVEHNAVARPLRKLEAMGATLTVIDCDCQGRLSMTDLKAALQKGVELVVVGHASNVTGAILPLGEIGRLVRQAGAIFAVDAAQTAGVEVIDVRDMNIDLLAFPGHKSLFGLQGTGGLYIRPGLNVEPRCFGGTGSMSESDCQPDFLPDMLESGTPNTPGLAGLRAGIEFIRTTGLDTVRKQERKMTEALAQGLARIPGVTIYGPANTEERTAVLCFTVLDIDCGLVAHLLDRDYGIACRSGLHCAPWAHRVLGTLKTGTVRLSPGYFTTMAEVETTIEAVARIAQSQGGKR